MTTDELVKLLQAPPDRWTRVKRFVAHWHEPLREACCLGARRGRAAAGLRAAGGFARMLDGERDNAQAIVAARTREALAG